MKKIFILLSVILFFTTLWGQDTLFVKQNTGELFVCLRTNLDELQFVYKFDSVSFSETYVIDGQKSVIDIVKSDSVITKIFKVGFASFIEFSYLNLTEGKLIPIANFAFDALRSYNEITNGYEHLVTESARSIVGYLYGEKTKILLLPDGTINYIKL